MSLKFSNFGKALVASAPSGITGLNFSVEAGKGVLFPSLGVGDYFYGIFKDASGNREIVKVTGKSGDSMTIASGGRGLDGTTARSWAAGDLFVAGLVNVALEESIASPLLSSIAGLSPTPDTMAYFTGPAASALTPLTAFARDLLSDEDALSMRNRLGAAGQAFPAGTNMLFYQKSAPVGWTHHTTALDHALRVVAGNGVGGTTGGSVNFSAAFKSQSVAGTIGITTLSLSQIPAHSHTMNIYETETGAGGVTQGGPTFMGASYSTNTSGGSGGHNHSFSGTPINLAVNYMNIIVAFKT